MNSSPRQKSGFAIMLAGLAVMTGGLLHLALVANVYEATTRLAVKPSPNVPVSSRADFDRHWTQSPLEQVQSKLVLYPVITNLNLTTAWAGKRKSASPLSVEDACRLLKKRLTVSQERNTSLVEIRVISPSREEAPQLANAIAHAYRDVQAGRLNTEVSSATSSPARVEIIERAVAPPRSRPITRPLALVLFLTGAVLVATGYALTQLGPKSPPVSTRL